MVHAVKDFTVKTVQKAADLAVHTRGRLSTDSASSYRVVKGYMHEFVNHTQKEYARGDMHENRAECLFPYCSLICTCFGASAKRTCLGTWDSFSSCATFDSRMHSSRPR